MGHGDCLFLSWETNRRGYTFRDYLPSAEERRDVQREVDEVLRPSVAAWLNGHANMVVPGSGLVKEQAEAEGLDATLTEAGFDWREPGCSMCLAMNPDKLLPQERCASTSNRNFEGRQGNGEAAPPFAGACRGSSTCRHRGVGVRA